MFRKLNAHRRVWGVFVAGLMAVGWSAAAQAAAKDNGRQRFLVISDIHFNPFYDKTLGDKLVAADPGGWDAVFATSQQKGLGAFGSDAPWPLLESAVKAMKTRAKKPAFILISGDLLAHKFRDLYNGAVSQPSDAGYQAFTAKTVAYFAGKLQAAYPGVPVVPALGNNDDDCGDYQIQPDGPFLKDTLATIKGMIGQPAGADFDASWLKGGNFAIAHPTLPKTRVVSVNTVFLTPKYKNACGAAGGSDPGSDTLNWLGQTLADARKAGEKVWLIQHVPPGIDVYSTTKYMSCPQAAPMYAPQYQTVYFPLMLQYADTVTASFSGHTHMDDFRLIGSGAKAAHTLITPAISPVFSQNPGFRAFDMTGDGVLRNHTTYYLTDLSDPKARGGKWRKEYDFRKAWAEKGPIDTKTMQAVYAKIAAGGATQSQYFNFYSVSKPGGIGITEAQQKAYVCAAGAAETADFVKCYCGATAQ